MPWRTAGCGLEDREVPPGLGGGLGSHRFELVCGSVSAPAPRRPPVVGPGAAVQQHVQAVGEGQQAEDSEADVHLEREAPEQGLSQNQEAADRKNSSSHYYTSIYRKC